MKKEIYNLDNINSIADLIISDSCVNKIAFYAPMGAGKTTLIKALVAALGGLDEVSSPTFGLVNEYHKPNGELLAYHFDFYRLQDETEALDMGIEDYLASDAWIFMEWPEKIPSLIPPDCVAIHIEILSPTKRTIRF